MVYETPAQRVVRLRTEALTHLEAAHTLLDETRDGAACYLTGCAIDERRSHEWPPRDEKVIPLVPRPGHKT
jgi:hypothetical protein